MAEGAVAQWRRERTWLAPVLCPSLVLFSCCGQLICMQPCVSDRPVYRRLPVARYWASLSKFDAGGGFLHIRSMQRVPASDALSLLLLLPDELLLCILDHVRAAGLAASACVSLRLQASPSSPLTHALRTQRRLRAPVRAAGVVGGRAARAASAASALPTLRRWRGEWPTLCAEQSRLASNEELPADGAYRPEELLPFATGELGAVEAQAALGLFADSIGWAQRAGWSQGRRPGTYAVQPRARRAGQGGAPTLAALHRQHPPHLPHPTRRGAATTQRADPSYSYGNLRSSGAWWTVTRSGRCY